MLPDQVSSGSPEDSDWKVRDCEYWFLVTSLSVMELIQENPSRENILFSQEKSYQSNSAALMREDQHHPAKCVSLLD